MLSDMVVEYIMSTGNMTIAQQYMSVLDAEYNFWNSSERVVEIVATNGNSYNLNRYFANGTTPRPESYRCARRQS
jgi:neutral trehalase